MAVFDVERIRHGEAPDCSSVLDTSEMPSPAVFMVDGKPLCRFCFEAKVPIAELIS